MPKLWVTVFCGSKMGKRPIFRQAAEELGQSLAARNYGLVYGGGHVGTMGVIADAVLAAGGQVQGVITQTLVDKEVAHGGLTKLITVGTMAERKQALIDLGDVSVTLPGAYGSLDELFEAVTLNQLKHNAKRCVLVNLDGYYDFQLRQLTRMWTEGFLERHHLEIVEICETVAGALPILEQVAQTRVVTPATETAIQPSLSRIHLLG